MSESKHTPGPWEIQGGALRIVNRHEWIATVQGATPENGLSPTPVKALANARLIAAAPLMYAALKTALELLDNSDVRHHISTTLGEQAQLHRALNSGRAALATAEGA